MSPKKAALIIALAALVVSSDARAGGTVITQPVGQQRVTGTCTSPNAITGINANGTVACSTGTGDITSVIAGTGLATGGTSGDVTLTIDSAYTQRRVSGTCVGSVLVGINADGTANCEADDNTTYTNGGGLSLAGTTFSVQDADRGDLTVSSSGTVWTIDNSAVTLAKQADIATARIMGRVTAGTGVQEALTGTQATTLLDTFSTSATTKGVVPGSNGGGATVYLDGTGAWSTPSGAGDITSVVAGDGLAGGATSGAATVDVTPGTGITITGDAVTLNMTAASCSAGSFVSAITATGGTTCTAEVGDISNVSVSGPISGGGASGSVAIGMTNADYGDITLSGGTPGSTWTVDNDAITYAKIQNVSATDRVLCRDTAAAGDIEECTVGGGLEFTGSVGLQRSALTGDVTASAGSNSTTIAAGVVTLAKMADIATDRLIGRDTAGTGVPEALTVGGGIEFTGSGGIQRSALTGDVTASAGSNSTTIGTDVVTYAKMQNVSATDRILCRDTAGAGDVEECTVSALNTMLGTSTGTGTANTTTKWTGTSTIGNGWALDDGTSWGVSGKFLITEATGATTITGLATGTAGFTTPADYTTTSTGSVVSNNDVTASDDLFVNDDSNIGNDTTDRHAVTGSLRNVLGNPGAGTPGSSWGDNWLVVGPNAASNTGAALGIGYSTTDDVAALAAVAPNVAWKAMYYGALGHHFRVAGGSVDAFEVASGGIARLYKSTYAQLKVGDDTEVNTAAQNGFSLVAYNTGTNYFDSKTQAGGSTVGRVGDGAEFGYARTWLTVTGATGATSLNNNVTLGDSSTADTHTVNGKITLTGPTGGRGIDATITSSAATSDARVFSGAAAGTFNTTGSAYSNSAVVGIANATRSAGANNLTNVALYGSATAGQVNYGLLVDDGDLRSDDSTTLGDSTINDSHTINGSTSLTSTGGSNAFTSTYSGSAQTQDRAAGNFVNSASFDTTSTAIAAYGAVITSNVTRSGGSNYLNSYGVYSSAAGAIGGGNNISVRGESTSSASNTGYGGYFTSSGAGTDIAVIADGADYNFYGGNATGLLYNAGPTSLNGGVAIGDNAADAHSITGTLTANATTGSNGDVLTLVTGVPKWATPSGGGNVTAAGLTTGKLPKASGASALVDSLVSESGSTVTITGGASITGGAAIGDNAADAHSLTGTLNANSTAGTEGQFLTIDSGVPVWSSGAATFNYMSIAPAGLTIAGTSSADSLVTVTGSPALTSADTLNYLVYSTLTATYDTTGGVVDSAAGIFVNTSTESAGGNVSTNYGVIGAASGADLNYAFASLSGDNLFNFSDGTTSVYTTANTLSRGLRINAKGLNSSGDGPGALWQINQVDAASFDVTSENATHSGATADATVSIKVALDGTLTERLKITSAGATTLTGTFNATGAGDFDSTLNVDGNTTHGGTTTFVGNLDDSNSAVTVADDLTVSVGDFLITRSAADSVSVATFTNDARSWKIKNDGADSDKFTIRDETGTTDRFEISSGGAFVMTGTVNATGAVDFDSTMNVDGAATIVGALDVTGALNGWTKLTQSADQDVTNAGVTDSNTFTFSTTAGKTYAIDGYVIAGGSNATGDYVFDWAVAAGTMDCSGISTTLNASDTAAIGAIIATAAADTGDTPVGTRADSTLPIAVRFSLACKVSNSTTLKYRFGNNTPSGSRVSRTRAGSRVWYRQID